MLRPVCGIGISISRNDSGSSIGEGFLEPTALIYVSLQTIRTSASTIRELRTG